MVPKIAPHVAWQIVDGEAIIVDLASGNTIGLNATGTFIWTQIDGDRDADSIAVAVAGEFNVDNEEAASHTREFLTDMNSRALVVDVAAGVPR